MIIARHRVRPSQQARSDRRLALALVAPSALVLAALSIYPFLYALYDSFFAIDPNTTLPTTFAGLGNYAGALTEAAFGQALKLSLQWTVGNIILQTALGVLIALLLDQELPGRGMARGFVLVPFVIPAIVVALIWRYMFNEANGVVNYLLLQAHLISQPLLWLSSPQTALWVIMVVNVWRYVPFMVIVFLARLQTLPPDQRDAVHVDGAGPLQEFRYITLPWLKPVIIIAMLLRTIWLFNEFDLVYLLGYGGPLGSTTTLPVLIRHLAFDVQSYGQACALAMSMAAILVVASWVYFRVYARAEEALQ